MHPEPDPQIAASGLEYEALCKVADTISVEIEAAP